MKLVWCAYFVFLPNVKGFFSYCDRNETLFIAEGSSATLSAEQPKPYPYPLVYKYNETRYRIYDPRSRFRFPFQDRWVENKIRVSVDLTNITITIHDVKKADNGTYVLHLQNTTCFVLFVVGINKHYDESIEEHSPAYFYAYPKASVIRRSIINARMMWLVDGNNVTHSPLFLVQDGMIWLASVSRTLNGRNVTYRAVQDDDTETEANYTIEVTYGPEAPLQFSPDTEHYFLSSGQTMPDVSCNVECNPSCNVSWDKHSTGNLLRLGTVSTETTGAYTCIATRPGTNRSVKRRLVVHVEDTSAFEMAVAVLASIQTVTTVVLLLFGIIICRRSNASPCSKSSYPRNNGDRETISVHTNEGKIMNDSALEQYEKLATEGRNDPNQELYDQVQTEGKNAEDMFYANTKNV